MSDLKAHLRRLRSSFNRDVREGKLQDPVLAEKWAQRLAVLDKLCAAAVEELGSSARLSFVLASVENLRGRFLEVTAED